MISNLIWIIYIFDELIQVNFQFFTLEMKYTFFLTGQNFSQSASVFVFLAQAMSLSLRRFSISEENHGLFRPLTLTF